MPYVVAAGGRNAPLKGDIGLGGDANGRGLPGRSKEVQSVAELHLASLSQRRLGCLVWRNARADPTEISFPKNSRFAVHKIEVARDCQRHGFGQRKRENQADSDRPSANPVRDKYEGHPQETRVSCAPKEMPDMLAQRWFDVRDCKHLDIHSRRSCMAEIGI